MDEKTLFHAYKHKAPKGAWDRTELEDDEIMADMISQRPGSKKCLTINCPVILPLDSPKQFCNFCSGNRSSDAGS